MLDQFRLQKTYTHNIKSEGPSEDLKDIQKHTCELCNQSYKSQESLKQHQRYTHKLPLRFKMTNNQDPIIDYTKLVCYSCGNKYKNKESLRSHLNRIHSFREAKIDISSRGLSSKDHTDTTIHCDLCHRMFKTYGSYMDHRRYRHTMIKANTQQKSRTPKIFRDVPPDINDPYFYCQSCVRRYKNHTSYMHHLRRIHKMKLRPWNTKLDSSKKDSNFFCDSCDYSYKNQKSFKYHEYSKHKYRPVTITTGKSPQPNARPIMDDPDGFCQACDRTFKSKVAYRMHVATTHNISLKSFRRSLPNHDVRTNIENDKTVYCPICLQPCRNKSHCRYHLFCKHEIPHAKVKEFI